MNSNNSSIYFDQINETFDPSIEFLLFRLIRRRNCLTGLETFATVLVSNAKKRKMFFVQIKKIRTQSFGN